MKRCHLAYLACTAALLGGGLGAAPAAAAHQTLVVRPGQSIQKAVDAARPGDTVFVLAGTYHESVVVNKPWVTLRGAGERTVVKPAATKTGKVANTCAQHGDGICVLGTKKKNVEGVTVADLKVTGFGHAGVFGMATDTLTVRRVQAVKNKTWGIATERSVHSVIRQNEIRGNGDAGLFLANTINEEGGAYDSGRTLVERNRLEDNRLGMTVRRLRNLTVTGNTVSGNCGGIFVVGDENKPQGGNLTVSSNRVVENNKFCAKTARLPVIQGSGIVLTGTEKTRVSGNYVAGHRGTSPLSGGIVLFKSMVGAKGVNNRIDRNTLANNSPADIVNTEAAKANVFERNSCRTSKPAGLC
ncbi:right-handed parallel beta-helix repeat-containing protein [Streptomyces sp. LaPpAH-108]|uniref:right-handed parallel beta-helix repeat-containing protein n=1 Tax=Streptomyces sp. LaPpAH-108 TaxID=1155714 RepID=UPI0003791A21|nr:right-handed parallel beta-helix repeat-containing protein [Streptomyces sp. LaPpAH-108]